MIFSNNGGNGKNTRKAHGGRMCEWEGECGRGWGACGAHPVGGSSGAVLEG